MEQMIASRLVLERGGWGNWDHLVDAHIDNANCHASFPLTPPALCANRR